ncbi:XRN 5'-3' exonuclease N-terminus-domain-containing protein [Chytridium lagenaria]|nr:XRN 5'-3' exonuclease N-terminus-domain-containing protein [Chytridium lagenaria]
MGIPKDEFFRWISERYPLCSNLIEEDRLPEFDNLYLDMNGIIHPAKMNQQRSRRFRAAKDAEEARRKAIAKGEELPKEAAFDSNCITPGTPFMARLSEQLKYFIAKKVSEDSSWADLKVILSGHEVPGEGEHKIMEYIRAYKASPEYVPNTRHCLYGLDADLMMLGLLSHEPHFALLREEVTFGRGKKKTSATSNPDNQNFYLMYLSVFREYLDLEFSPLRDSLTFEYDLERIIDDFILLSFFIGNDFLPHLPELSRLEELLKGIGALETEQFMDTRSDIKFLDSKRDKRLQDRLWVLRYLCFRIKSPLCSYNKAQSSYLARINEFIVKRSFSTKLKFSTNMPARDRKFIMTVAKSWAYRLALKQMSLSLWCSEDDDSDEESSSARMRVLKKYDKAEVMDDKEITLAIAREAQSKFDSEFADWKRSYYKMDMLILKRKKIEFDPVTKPNELSTMVYQYVLGLQWVLFYYYRGVPSWGWFYPYHYAPKITDLVELTRFHPLELELGTPFKPFYQLMGVLPAASKTLIPEVYRDLMTDPNSPIVDFYPTEFELDLNGKKTGLGGARENQLSADEKQRNSVGKAILFEKSSGDSYNFASSSQGFVDIRTPQNPFCGLMPGSSLGSAMKPGFPSLGTIPYTGSLGFHGVNVFNSESTKESMVISLNNQYEGKSIDALALSLIGSRVFVGWPFLSEALVTGVMDELFTYSVVDGGHKRELVRNPHNQDTQDRFYNSIERIELSYSKRFGTITGPIEVVVTARVLKGMSLNEDGALLKDFNSARENDFGLQTVVVGSQHEDPRFEEKPPPPLIEEFPMNSQIFFLGNIHFGALGEIRGHTPEGLCSPFPKALLDDLNTTRSIAMGCEEIDKYLPSFKVTKVLGMSSLVLSKLTSSLHVSSRGRGDQKFNAGLNLKFDGKGKKVLGYTRKSENGWEYSSKAVELIREYKTKFPELIAGLEKKSRNDLYDEHDFFAREVATERTAQLKEWLKQKGVRDFDRVNLDSKALPKTVSRAFMKLMLIVKNVPRIAILKPAQAKHRLGHQTYELGERVLNVSDVGNVPIGARGTVIGMIGKMIDVVFDFPFIGAHILDGRCSTNRGLSVYKDSVLNTSRPQPPKGLMALTSPKIPERIAGKPLMSPAERNAAVNPVVRQEAPVKVINNAWEITTGVVLHLLFEEYVADFGGGPSASAPGGALQTQNGGQQQQQYGQGGNYRGHGNSYGGDSRVVGEEGIGEEGGVDSGGRRIRLLSSEI